jgi:membrane protein DedA with SNARE-associated domain
MMEDLLAWLEATHGPLGYLVLAASAMIEYLIPPIPGDTIALFGIVLAAGAGYSTPLVYLALNAGSVAGGMTAYGFGRWLANRRERVPPRFAFSGRTRKAIDKLVARFERHGVAYLALNRFVPALRGLFFIAAGMARLPWWKVAFWGLVSASLWNALLLGLGWVVGANLEKLQSYLSIYSYVAIGVIAVVVVAVWIVRRRRAPAEEPE